MKKLIKITLISLLLIALIIVFINFYIILSVKNKIVYYNLENIDVDCILILGASVKNNHPSPMLEDRLKKGIELYNNHVSKKILVSGDHISDDYDEVSVMKNYLIEHGIPSNEIFVDHLGISSYDSIYRAKKIYKAKKIVIITQKYHLYRSLYIANKLDIEAYGVPTSSISYSGQYKREIREIAARVKDFFKCIIKPESTFLGEVHPIKGNGNKTNDK